MTYWSSEGRQQCENISRLTRIQDGAQARAAPGGPHGHRCAIYTHAPSIGRYKTVQSRCCATSVALRAVRLCICVMLTESPGSELRHPCVNRAVVECDRPDGSGLLAPGRRSGLVPMQGGGRACGCIWAREGRSIESSWDMYQSLPVAGGYVWSRGRLVDRCLFFLWLRKGRGGVAQLQRPNVIPALPFACRARLDATTRHVPLASAVLGIYTPAPRPSPWEQDVLKDPALRREVVPHQDPIQGAQRISPRLPKEYGLRGHAAAVLCRGDPWQASRQVRDMLSAEWP